MSLTRRRSGCPGEPNYTDSGLVITVEDGRPMHPETLSGLFVRQARRTGLPPIRLHDLRHSVAPILLAQGVHPKVVSELAGCAPSGRRWRPPSTAMAEECRNLGPVPPGCRGQRRPGQGRCGGQGRDRTADLAVFSRTLYRLSYLPGGPGRHCSGPSGPDGI